MIEKKIDHIAYQLKQNFGNKQPGAIVFIGAGCSVSAGIPVADKIVEYVLENYKDNPDIKCLSKKPSYEELMECLGPRDRKEIFKHYVEAAKINVSHIYLAHLMNAGYVDYIVTVNFDNLAQRALALYNEFPPAYDISILKDLTTTSLDKKSIIYLHGQYNGLWQLNTKEEMRKVIDSDVAKTIFHQITNNRLWIVIGYSGEDFIFEQLIKLGRFDNGLYWVGYKDNEPVKKVQQELLNKPNTESFWVKGHDSDSFFLKLNSELKKESPKIFIYPFTFLSELQNNIVDIDDSAEYKPVKERFVKSKEMVVDAINRYDKTDKSEQHMTTKDIEYTQLGKELIECLINERFNDLEILESRVRKNGFHELLTVVADIYLNWGASLGDLAATKTDLEAEKLYKESFEKFSKAIELKPNLHEAYYNWGTSLGDLAKTKTDSEAEKLYKEAFKKFSKAIEIKPNEHEAYSNWGTSLGDLAKRKTGSEAEKLYKESFEKFSKAIELKPNLHEAYYNWGTSLGDLAKTKTDSEAEKLYKEAFNKFSKAIELKPDKYEAYYNWGTSLGDLAKRKTGSEAESLYRESFEKFSKAIEIKPDEHEAYYNWGTSLGDLAERKTGSEAETLYKEAFKKFSKVIEIKKDEHEAYSNWGTSLADLAKMKTDSEAETLYNEAFKKFSKAIEIKSDEHETYSNWGTSLGDLAKRKTGSDADELYKQAIEKLNNSVELGGSCYNLACINAVTSKQEDAFHLLEISLQKNEITFEYVEKDTDWDGLREEPQYRKLKELYLK